MATLSQSTGTKVSAIDAKVTTQTVQPKASTEELGDKLRQTTVAIASSQIGLSYGVARMSTRQWIRHYLEMVSAMANRRRIIRQLDPSVIAAETEALKKRHEELQAERRKYEVARAAKSAAKRGSTSASKASKSVAKENSEQFSQTVQVAPASQANAPKSKSHKGLKL